MRRRVRVQRQHDAQKTVCPDLREHAGEGHQHLDRHRLVAVGHPAVQREGGHLDEERRGEQQEDPVLRVRAQGHRLERGEHEGDVATALLCCEHTRGDCPREHQQRAHQGVDDQLDRRPHASRLGAPDSDQEVEGDQHEVEEGDEQRQVLGQQGAQDGRLGEHQVEVEEPRTLPLAQVGREHRGGEQQRRESHQEHVQPVDAELVVNA